MNNGGLCEACHLLYYRASVVKERERDKEGGGSVCVAINGTTWEDFLMFLII